MTIHHKSDIGPDRDANPVVQLPDGERHIRNVNWIGLQTLYMKEVRRFFKVQMQTVWAPAITTLLYLIIFTVALGSVKPKVLGVSFADFIAPGLIIMGMMQNAFANSSFSLLVGKMQGTIVDYLMPPLSNAEVLFVQCGGFGRADICCGDPRVSGGRHHLACNGNMARRQCHPSAYVGDIVVRPDGFHDAGVDRRYDIDLGGEVRPCGRG